MDYVVLEDIVQGIEISYVLGVLVGGKKRK